MESRANSFRPLVVGAPRSGFALLCSVVIHFLPMTRRDLGLRQEILTGYAKPTPPPGEATPISDGVNLIPARAEEFRRRPIRTSGETFHDVPVNVEWSFLGHNLVRFDGRYYALPRGAGPVDLLKLRSRNKLGRVLSAPDLQRLEALIVMRSRNKLGNLVSRLKLLSTLDVQTLKALISKALR